MIFLLTVPNEADVDHQGRPVSPPSPIGKTGFSSIMRKAAIAAKQAMAAAAASQRLDPNVPLPLRCCLMSLSLPWDALATDLLFKVCLQSDHVYHLAMNVETLVCFSCAVNKWLLLNQKSAKGMLRWTYQLLRPEKPKIPKSIV